MQMCGGSAFSRSNIVATACVLVEAVGAAADCLLQQATVQTDEQMYARRDRQS